MPTNVVKLIQPAITSELIKYDAACRAIIEAKSVDEAKEIRDKSIALAAYARQAKNKNLEADAIEIRLRATQKLGLLIQAQKDTVGLASGGEYGGRPRIDGLRANPSIVRPTLASQGIDKNLANSARKLAILSDTRFETIVSDTRKKVLTPSTPIQNTHYGPSNGEFELYTPEKYIKLVCKVFGNVIDLDPASCRAANRTVKAKRFFTVDDNALLKDWTAKNVFANFPYARGIHKQFITKLVEEYQCGHVPEAIMLTHTGIDTKWFHMALAASSSVCFVYGKIAFLEENGQPNAQGLPGGNMFFYYGKKIKLFESVFSRIGTCVQLSRRYSHSV